MVSFAFAVAFVVPLVFCAWRFEEGVCLRLTVLWEMQVQAACVEGTVGVPGSVLVLGGSSPF